MYLFFFKNKNWFIVFSSWRAESTLNPPSPPFKMIFKYMHVKRKIINVIFHKGFTLRKILRFFLEVEISRLTRINFFLFIFSFFSFRNYEKKWKLSSLTLKIQRKELALHPLWPPFWAHIKFRFIKNILWNNPYTVHF